MRLVREELALRRCLQRGDRDDERLGGGEKVDGHEAMAKKKEEKKRRTEKGAGLVRMYGSSCDWLRLPLPVVVSPPTL